jgi:hypothetical protein
MRVCMFIIKPPLCRLSPLLPIVADAFACLHNRKWCSRVAHRFMEDLSEFFRRLRSRATHLEHLSETGPLTPAQQAADHLFFSQCLDRVHALQHHLEPETYSETVGAVGDIIQFLEDDFKEEVPSPPNLPPVHRVNGPGRPRIAVPDEYMRGLAYVRTLFPATCDHANPLHLPAHFISPPYSMTY